MQAGRQAGRHRYIGTHIQIFFLTCVCKYVYV